MSADCSSNCMYRVIWVTSRVTQCSAEMLPFYPTGLLCVFRATSSVLAKLLAAHGSEHILGMWEREAAGPADGQDPSLPTPSGELWCCLSPAWMQLVQEGWLFWRAGSVPENGPSSLALCCSLLGRVIQYKILLVLTISNISKVV